MKKLLLIAYFYPPLGGPGVQRPSKLVKYLDNLGVLTDVITVKNIVFHSTDDNLLREDKAHRIIRVKSSDPMSILRKFTKPKVNATVYFKTPEKFKRIIRNIFPIDDKIGWLPFVLMAGKKLIYKNKYDSIMATMGPYTSGVAAYKLSKKYNLPLLIDYRDHWTLNPYIIYFSKFHKLLSEKWEKKILDFATAITVVSEKMKNELISKFGSELASKIEVMYNGWDEEDFSNTIVHKKERLRIKYIGNFYGHRTPKYFIKALELLNSRNQLPENILIEFTGNYYSETIEYISNSKVYHFIKIKPQVEHKDAIKSLMNCDALLLFIASHKGNGVLTGKLFEYIRSGKEILAMVPPNGEAAQILRQNQHNMICEMENVEMIAQNFLNLLETLKTGNCRRQIPIDYNRENQTKKFLHFVENKLKTQITRKKIVHIQLLPLLSGAQNVMLKILESLDRDKYEIYVISKPGGPLVNKVKELGYKHVPVSSFRRNISFMDIIAFIKLYKIIKKYKFDIVHTHSSKSGFLGRFAARIAGVHKIIHTVHGFPFHYAQPKLVRFFYQFLEKIVSPFCDKVIFVNDYERELAIDYKIIKPENALTIYNGIDIKRIKLAQRSNKNDNFVVGSVLRFEKIKNIINTVKVAIRVCKSNDRFIFHFIGDGKLLEDCRKMILEAGLEKRIILPGWKENINDLLADFDVFLLYSIAEGLSISILEAMSMSLPIIASDVKGNNELVSDSNGVLVPINDIDRLTAVLLSLPDNLNQLKKWGTNSFKIVEEKFNLLNFIRKYNDIYEEER